MRIINIFIYIIVVIFWGITLGSIAFARHWPDHGAILIAVFISFMTSVRWFFEEASND